MVELRHVEKAYGRPEGPDYVEVLRGIDLTVEPGQTMAIMGPSGSGKTTLLNLIGTIDLPTRGQVLWDGQDVAAMSEGQRALLRNQRIGFVFQMHYLLPQCTALENVLLPTLARPGGPSRPAIERARQLLERVGLARQADSMPGRLSGGQRQRVAIARALINGPRLLLADEPTGSLDAQSAEGVIDLLLELSQRDGLALIVVTHAEAVARMFAPIYRLSSGRLCQDLP
ncbi:MAG: ABC transporter ATP-binding protein [Sedimentisphaerales bacterium]|nr:ABC transporter ATP-binding protein [Sedimentisphaerales bacterium]